MYSDKAMLIKPGGYLISLMGSVVSSETSKMVKAMRE